MNCTVDGCDKPGPYVRKMCNMHYTRFKRGVDLNKPVERRGLSLSERIWQYVDVVDFDQCWEWKAHRTEQGYGRGSDENNRSVAAHRFTYESFWNKKLLGLACHTCNNPPCCNPFHIYDGTYSTNALDAVHAGTANFLRSDLPRARGETHGRAKMTDEKVREMRRLYAEGKATQKQLAEQFGIGQSKVSGIVRHKTWRHVMG